MDQRVRVHPAAHQTRLYHCHSVLSLLSLVARDGTRSSGRRNVDDESAPTDRRHTARPASADNQAEPNHLIRRHWWTVDKLPDIIPAGYRAGLHRIARQVRRCGAWLLRQSSKEVVPVPDSTRGELVRPVAPLFDEAPLA